MLTINSGSSAAIVPSTSGDVVRIVRLADSYVSMPGNIASTPEETSVLDTVYAQGSTLCIGSRPDGKPSSDRVVVLTPDESSPLCKWLATHPNGWWNPIRRNSGVTGWELRVPPAPPATIEEALARLSTTSQPAGLTRSARRARVRR